LGGGRSATAVGTEGGRLAQRQGSRFGLIQVWASHGWREQEHPEWVAEWLLVEWPQGAPEPIKYWLVHFEASLSGLQRVVRMAESRWRIELDYRELKEELGLDHHEGRHWLGRHHHVCLVSLAYAFLDSEQARAQKNSWYDPASHEEAPASPAD
jgi:SRSO17 transposase